LKIISQHVYYIYKNIGKKTDI